MRQIRVIVAAAALAAVAGCAAEGPPPVVTDRRMPLVVDTYEHRIVHPPIQHDTGRVDPVDPGPGRTRAFGPQSRVDPSPRQPARGADMAAFLRSAPAGADDFLALATTRKKIKTAKQVDEADADDPSPPLVSSPSGPSPSPVSHGAQDQDGGYRLNFEDAEIKDVLQAVLGNLLGLTYTIAPNVTGRITISSAATQSKSELLATLETVLSLQGLSLTKVGSTYRVAPAAIGGGTLDRTGSEPGFGISVVPLEFSSVASMNKLLSGFVTDADGIRIDSARNAIIIRGPGPRREEIVRAIKSFDSDWMHSQSVSVIELRRSRPDEVIQELTRIFDADAAGESGGVIQFKAMRRLRSIMVISKNPQLVKRAIVWIRRLDHQDTSAADAVFVYRPRYRDAKEMVRLVNGLFNADSSGGSVAFQQQGQGGTAQQQQGSQGTIGQSSASFAGSLSSNGLSGATGPSSGGIGSGGIGSGGLGQSAGGAGPSGGLQFGQGTATAGSGLQGNLADPIEAGQNPASGGAKLRLTADVSNNTIVAYTDGATYSKVQAILKQIDIAPLQVAINVVVAEVQLNDELKYGVQFYLNNKKGSVGLSQVLSSAAGTAATAIAPQAAGLNFLLGGASSPNLVLNALDSVSKVHILSTPSIVVMENKPAVFEVGNQVPVVTQTATSTLTAGAPTLNQVTYLDTGIILKIIPRIGQMGEVAMDLDQVISSVVPDATGAPDTSLTPTISKRRVNSAISVRSGQSVLLAGLINDTRQQQRGQVPFLGGGLGDVFGNRDNVVSRTELVIFINPVIVRNGQDASEIASEFKSRLRAINAHGAPVYKP